MKQDGNSQPRMDTDEHGFCLAKAITFQLKARSSAAWFSSVCIRAHPWLNCIF